MTLNKAEQVEPTPEPGSHARPQLNPDTLPGSASVFDENGVFVAYKDVELGWWYDPASDRWRT